MVRTYRNKLIYLLFLLVPVFFLILRPGTFSTFQFKIIRMSDGALSLLAVPVREIKKIIFYHRTFEEYKKLRREVNALKARLIGTEEVIRENTRLEELLQFKRSLVYSSVTANVIGRDPTRWNSIMIIDRGEKDGIRQGMPVVNALGVVGKITDVGPEHSKVILLTDPGFSVAALVPERREHGLVTGSLQGLCRMRYLQQDALIRPGDKVITSKLSSSFPEGLMIGEVIRFEEDQQNQAPRCIILPAAPLSQIEEVLVILK